MQADEKRGLSFNELPFDIFYRFPYLPMQVFIKVTNWLSGESRGRQEILMRLTALLSQQFLPVREWRCEGIANTFSAIIKVNGRTTV